MGPYLSYSIHLSLLQRESLSILTALQGCYKIKHRQKFSAGSKWLLKINRNQFRKTERYSPQVNNQSSAIVIMFWQLDGLPAPTLTPFSYFPSVAERLIHATPSVPQPSPCKRALRLFPLPLC